MTGFEKDDWDLHVFRDGWKTAIHKKYPFIRMNIIKTQKGFNHKGPIWRAHINSWNLRDNKSRNILVEYKKLTIHKIPEIFDKLMKLDSVKEAIFNHLFEGKI